MKTQCPNCKKEFESPDEYNNQTVKCPFCKQAFLAIKKDITYTSKPASPIPDNKIPPMFYTLPDNGYLQGFAVLAIIIACFCILGGLDKDPVISVGGLLLFFISIGLIGLGTIIRAINANTEELKKRHNP